MFGSGLKLELIEARFQIARLEDKLETAQGKEAELAAAKAQVVELDKKNAVLLERLDLLVNHIPQSAPTQAYNSPEELEDAEWALRNGQIDHSEFEEILASAGALNAEIAFDTSAIPRIGS